MMMHPFVAAMHVGRDRRELTATVHVQHAQLVASLDLCCLTIARSASPMEARSSTHINL